jgi:hypothetical protein
MTRYVTDLSKTVPVFGFGENVSIDPTPSEAEVQDPEQYRLYRLCQCGTCAGTGKVGTSVYVSGAPAAKHATRCKECRGEGRALDLVATCGTPEAVGVALITLGLEGEWDECPIGIMHRPEGENGRWIVKPWLPSARNVSDAGRTLARSKNTTH